MAGSAWTNQVQNQVIVGGANGRVLVYSGTPASGNLVGSVAGASGTDQFGNAYLSGTVSYSTSAGTWFAVQIGSAVGAGAAVNFYTASSAAGPWTLQGSISTDTNGILAVNAAKAIWLEQPMNAALTALQPGTLIQESWHTLTISGTGLSAGSPAPAYKLYPDNTVSVQGEVNAASGTTSGTFATLPAGYQPLSTKKWAVPISAGTPAVAANAQITISSSGAIQLSAGPTGAAYSFALDVARFPLDQ